MTTAVHPPIATSAEPSHFRSIDAVRFLLDPRFRADPYPLYDRLRAHERVHHASVGATLVSGYDECLAVLKDPHVSSDERLVDLRFSAGRDGAGLLAEAPGRLILNLANTNGRGEGTGSFMALARDLLINLDPPDHTRIRRLASRAFTPKTVDQLRPHAEAISHRLLDAMEPHGGTELLASYCYELPPPHDL